MPLALGRRESRRSGRNGAASRRPRSSPGRRCTAWTLAPAMSTCGPGWVSTVRPRPCSRTGTVRAPHRRRSTAAVGAATVSDCGRSAISGRFMRSNSDSVIPQRPVCGSSCWPNTARNLAFEGRANFLDPGAPAICGRGSVVAVRHAGGLCRPA